MHINPITGHAVVSYKPLQVWSLIIHPAFSLSLLPPSLHVHQALISKVSGLSTPASQGWPLPDFRTQFSHLLVQEAFADTTQHPTYQTQV